MHFFFSANGAGKTGESDQRIPKAISTIGHDGNLPF